MQKFVLATLILISLVGTPMNNLNSNLIPQTGLIMEAPRATVNSIAARPIVANNITSKGTSTKSSLQDFVQSVSTGQRDTVTGVYIPNVLALPVGQQPKGNAGFVTREPEQVTQFNLAGQYGTIGILAHNDLAGAEFSGIQMNQFAIVVYGDGHLEYYQIDEVQKYQALNPTSTFSDFVNLADTNERLSAGDLFTRVYGPGNRLVFQTCIAANGDPSWGRMFIIAHPANQEILSILKQTTYMLNFASFGLAAD